MPCERVRGRANTKREEPTRLVVAGRAICLVHCSDGRFFAVSDECTHENDASLSEGWVSGTEIECARHNSIFSLETGAALSMPACDPLRTFRVTVAGDDLLIEVD
jgi:3-phenylpropionate/trans-cinnamate dioxygenase ferredoxin component